MRSRSSLLFAFVVVAGCDPAPYTSEELDYAPVFTAPDCRPNNDGVIDANELPFVLGATARVRVGENIDLDVDGEVIDGVRTWDLTRPDPTTEPQGGLTLETMEGQWFADRFPEAPLAGPLQPGGGLLGALLPTDDAVLLYGAATKDENPPQGQSLIVYDGPAVLYPLPLTVGASASSTVRAQNAVLLGLQTALVDVYDVEVTAVGTVILPDLILNNSLRVTLRLTRTLLAGDVQQVTHVWLHECLGEVARAVGPAVGIDEEAPERFPTAAEVWRLAL
jgi:hypothetical protein